MSWAALGRTRSSGAVSADTARGYDFAAWLALTPLQRFLRRQTKAPATSRMGERTLR